MIFAQMALIIVGDPVAWVMVILIFGVFVVLPAMVFMVPYNPDYPPYMMLTEEHMKPAPVFWCASRIPKVKRNA